MNRIQMIINSLKEHWSQPRKAIHRGEISPFPLICSFASKGIQSDAIAEISLDIPSDVSEFWNITESAFLFKDVQYGQWGIEVLDPAHAWSETQRQIALRPAEFANTDLILGRFLGDSDLVVISCDPKRNFGTVTIALPIDHRGNWPIVAESFAAFLDYLVQAQGDKYWETEAGKL